MNLAYFRKTKKKKEKIIADLKKELKSANWKIYGEYKLKEAKGIAVSISKEELTDELISKNRDLVGFLPNIVLILEAEGKRYVGIADTNLWGGLTRDPKISELGKKVSVEIKEIINNAAGVEALKPSGIKLYATSSCPYCKMEHAWLDQKGIKHDMVMVDLNQKEAERMVKMTGQMGVPVTEIRFEDSDSEFVVGFDKNKLAATLDIES